MDSERSPEFTIEQVDWEDPRAVELRTLLDTEIRSRYSDRWNGAEAREVVEERERARAVVTNAVAITLLAVDANGTPVGHAALRALRDDWEVKRVVVLPGQRGRGIAKALMAELEGTARERGITRVILQTGDRQPEAVTLYEQLGYSRIPIYEPYVTTVPFSLCFEKILG